LSQHRYQGLQPPYLLSLLQTGLLALLRLQAPQLPGYLLLMLTLSNSLRWHSGPVWFRAAALQALITALVGVLPTRLLQLLCKPCCCQIQLVTRRLLLLLLRPGGVLLLQQLLLLLTAWHVKRFKHLLLQLLLLLLLTAWRVKCIKLLLLLLLTARHIKRLKLLLLLLLMLLLLLRLQGQTAARKTAGAAAIVSVCP
jgi:hypothetical protein